MDQLMPFIISHWWLVLIFVVLLGLVIQVELSSNIHGIRMISTQEIIMLMNRGEAVVIDIRSLEAYNKEHIINSLSYPEKAIFDNIKLLQHKYHNKTLIIICGNGQQSPKVSSILKKQHKFEKIYGMKGGFNTWLAEKLPTIRSEA